MAHHLGIDVAKKKLDVCLLASGKPKHKVVDNTQEGFKKLTAWLTQHIGQEPLHACLEATNVYSQAVAEYLHDAGHQVSVVNPAQVKAFATTRQTRSKTDQIDAKLIAEFCSLHQPPLWQPPSPAARVLRELVAQRDALITNRTQVENRSQTQIAPALQHSLNHLKYLNDAIKTIQKEIQQHIDNDPDLKRNYDLLDSVPGLGERTIPLLMAYYPQPERFRSAKAAVAFAGLDPRQRQSGSSLLARPCLSKIGHATLRAALYMPAMTALHKTAWGTVFRQRLAAANKPPKLIIAAMMRKILAVAFGVLQSKTPFRPELHGA